MNTRILPLFIGLAALQGVAAAADDRPALKEPQEKLVGAHDATQSRKHWGQVSTINILVKGRKHLGQVSTINIFVKGSVKGSVNEIAISD